MAPGKCCICGSGHHLQVKPLAEIGAGGINELDRASEVRNRGNRLPVKQIGGSQHPIHIAGRPGDGNYEPAVGWSDSQAGHNDQRGVGTDG